jgi:hypothetical protein
MGHVQDAVGRHHAAGVPDGLIDQHGAMRRRHAGPRGRRDRGQCLTRFSGGIVDLTDGHKAYMEAAEGAFGDDVDYAQIVKLSGMRRFTRLTNAF